MTIEFLHDAFKHVNIPTSNYDAKKLLNKLCLNYTKIHACFKNCMLHWGEDVDREKCKTCHAFRWKQKGHENASDHGLMVGKRQKELPANFL